MILGFFMQIANIRIRCQDYRPIGGCERWHEISAWSIIDSCMRCSAFKYLFAIGLLSLAGCSQDSSALLHYPPPDYGYLTKIELNVGRIDIDHSWKSRGAGQPVDHLAPNPPVEAQRQMAKDRLVAVGKSGRAVFVIEDASIVRGPRDYEASLAVRLDIADHADNLLAQSLARVSLVRPVGGETERGIRDDLYVLVRDLMDDMNVEFEYQIRKSLREARHLTDTMALGQRPADASPVSGSAPVLVSATVQATQVDSELLRDVDLDKEQVSLVQAVKMVPATVAVATKMSGRKNFVQLAVAGSEAEAPEQWQRLRRRLGPLLDGRETLTVQAEVGGRTVWRLRIPFAGGAEALSFCEAVRGSGAACWVASNSGQ